MYVIRFREQDFDLLSIQDLFFTRDRKEAEIFALDLNHQLQNIVAECKKQGILGCVEIPELKVFILSTKSILSIEMVEVDRITDIGRLTYNHLLKVT